MSANVDLVRSIYADWERGDFSSVEWAHPQIVFESDGFDGTRSAGIAEMSERWREWMSAWEEYRAEAAEFRELAGKRVLVLMRHGGRGKASGVATENEGASVWDICDGKATKLAIYWDRDRAFAALGLEA
jgi:ketosteroid isomerase-like protein